MKIPKKIMDGGNGIETDWLEIIKYLHLISSFGLVVLIIYEIIK